MKNTILTLVVVCISTGAFCQKITFNDLLHFLNEKNEFNYIHHNGFEIVASQTNLGHTVSFYAINDRSTKTEILLMGFGVTKKDGEFLHEVAYDTKDTSYIYSLIKQINRESFKLTKRRLGKKRDFYQFDKNDLYVQVVIQHTMATPNQINIRHKFF
jgi:hypothetical protein